ncbi:MAG: hypothetical protein SD837_07540 [Candidatus Electrothrix scaldis]|nr:MAG: hypothetical protein SD837_07540 [Candidatus Electrothrix sp. GW3-3]
MNPLIADVGLFFSLHHFIPLLNSPQNTPPPKQNLAANEKHIPLPAKLPTHPQTPLHHADRYGNTKQLGLLFFIRNLIMKQSKFRNF